MNMMHELTPQLNGEKANFPPFDLEGEEAEFVLGSFGKLFDKELAI